MTTIIGQNELITIIQNKTGLTKDRVEIILAVALDEMKYLLKYEDIETPIGVLSEDSGKVLLDKKLNDRRSMWLARSQENYQKVLKTNNAWHKTDKGRKAQKRNKGRVAKLIRYDYAFEVKALRSETGLSQRDFSDFVGIKKSLLQAAEQGVTYLSDDLIQELLIGLGYDGSELEKKLALFASFNYPVSVIRGYLMDKFGVDDEELELLTDKEIKTGIMEWKEST